LDICRIFEYTTGRNYRFRAWKQDILTPSEFSDILLGPVENIEKTVEGIVIATFFQDTDYRIKNAPLESYVRYQINNYNIQNITSQQYTTVGK
jgi:hypothetical protein